MKTVLNLLALAFLMGRVAAAEQPLADAALRTKVLRTLGAEPAEQPALVLELGDTGAKLVRDVLTAWTRDGLGWTEQPDGTKVVVLLEEQQDADGKARGIRIDSAQLVKDSAGAEMRFGATDITPIDTDARLRAAIQQALDRLALSDPNPDVRRSAVLKLGNSAKEGHLGLLEMRLEKENNASVRKGIAEAMAMLRLGSTNPAVQVAAIEKLGQLKAIGSLDGLRRIAASPQTSPAVLSAAKSAIHRINEHISWVNFFGTIFRGLSLGSILLVVALGLAITFGLMGVINMAHGEMIAVGAYTCYVVQNVMGSGFGFSITLPFQFGSKPITLDCICPA
ncbi:MAG: hypothetical protein U1G07_03050 [Verrucomicrobiota bacterium]